jgi:hypothetical protein
MAIVDLVKVPVSTRVSGLYDITLHTFSMVYLYEMDRINHHELQEECTSRMLPRVAQSCHVHPRVFEFKHGTEVYKRAVSATHQDVTAKNVLAQLGIPIDEPSAEMWGGQKDCVQQQYSAAAKTKKNNILRVGTKAHRVRVNREQGKHAGTKPNWEQPKEVFFNSTNNPNKPNLSTYRVSH